MVNPLAAPDDDEGEQPQDNNAGGSDGVSIHTKGIDTEARPICIDTPFLLACLSPPLLQFNRNRRCSCIPNITAVSSAFSAIRMPPN